MTYTHIGSETIGAGNQTHYYQDGDGATYAQDCIGAWCGGLRQVMLSAGDLAQMTAQEVA